MTSALRIAAATIVVALVAAAPAGARPAAAKTNFYVLAVVSTGWSVELSQDHVAATLYTLQLHNNGAYPAHFTIGVPGSKPLTVFVQPNGWKFPRLHLRPGTLSVKVATRPGAPFGASIPIQ
jgi:hypothetical protein